MEDKKFKGLQERLEKLSWPSIYMFKFIVPTHKEEDLVNIFGGKVTERKYSQKGNYVSITSTFTVESSESVLRYYKEASRIEGVVAL
jgi:putative lipoic acid-binding regulatory protein